MPMTYEDLCAAADRLELGELRAQRGHGENSSLDVIRKLSVHCPNCDDRANANCADTLRTFGAMHVSCTEMQVSAMDGKPLIFV